MQFFTTDDGARIAYRDEGTGIPVLALSGLTRTMADFDYVAPHLTGCRLIRMDYRGRGASDFTGAATYTVLREGQDALQLLDHLGVARAAILGTSRGGLIGMYLAYTAKARLSGLCLNDVGPALEHGGLVRIFDYLGRNPAAKTVGDLVAKMPQMMPGFAHVPPERWTQEVANHYILRYGRPVINYDPALRDPFIEAFRGETVPTAWPLFDACAGLPLCLIRGANSDLLSTATAAQMRLLRPDMIYAEVPDRAHVPFLDEAEAVAALHHWIATIAA